MRVTLSSKILMKLSKNALTSIAKLSWNHRWTNCLFKIYPVKNIRNKYPCLTFVKVSSVSIVSSVTMICILNNGGSHEQNENMITACLNPQPKWETLASWCWTPYLSLNCHQIIFICHQLINYNKTKVQPSALQTVMVSMIRYPFYWQGLTLIPVWISNYIFIKCGMKLIIHSQLQRCSRWSWVKDT